MGDRGRVELRLQAGVLHDVEQLGGRVGDAVGERVVVLVGGGLGRVDEGVGLALHGGADRPQLFVDLVLHLRVAVGVGQVVGLAVEHVGVAQVVAVQVVGGLRHVDADVLLLGLALQGVVFDLGGKFEGPPVAPPCLVPAAALEQVVRLVQVAFDRLDLRHLLGAQQLEQAVPGDRVVAGQALYAQFLQDRGVGRLEQHELVGRAADRHAHLVKLAACFEPGQVAVQVLAVAHCRLVQPVQPVDEHGAAFQALDLARQEEDFVLVVVPGSVHQRRCGGRSPGHSPVFCPAFIPVWTGFVGDGERSR